MTNLRRRIRRLNRRHNNLRKQLNSVKSENEENFRKLTQEDRIQAIVIGAGPSGAYAARRLRKRFPAGRILVLEKTGRVGGRLLSGYEVSNQKGNSPVYDELGGMRVFTQLMENVVDVINETECNLVQVPQIGRAHV